MSDTKVGPDLAEAAQAEEARVPTRGAKASVSTRITRAAPWVGLLAVAIAGVLDMPSVGLATVLDDPTAIPDRRLGAALALLAATPEPQRPAVRVRVAELAEAAADDRLAKAFEELSRDALTPRTAARVREA